MLSIGLMSGTSMDGIDAALLETDGLQDIKMLGFISLAYDESFKLLLKATEYAIRKYSGDIDQVNSHFQASLHEYFVHELHLSPPSTVLSTTLDKVIQQSTHLHGLAVNQLLSENGYAPDQIDILGYHGQTMLHQPHKNISIIIGDGKALANQTRIAVINDFRRRDVAAGGQGAPFAPLYHYALALRDNKIPIAVINCGGIANITLIPSRDPSDIIAFDTGPGNGLIDRIIRQRTSGKENMDTDGHYAKKVWCIMLY